MTAAELREVISDLALNEDLNRSNWVLAQCLASIVDALEQVREEMITRMPLLEERRESGYPFVDDTDHNDVRRD